MINPLRCSMSGSEKSAVDGSSLTSSSTTIREKDCFLSAEVAEVNQKTEKNIGQMVDSAAKQISGTQDHLDSKFICGEVVYKKTLNVVVGLQNISRSFDLPTHFVGDGQKSAAADVIIKNANLMNIAIEAYTSLAKEIVLSGDAENLEDAYKMLVGVLDKYDESAVNQFKENGITPESSYFIRTALLKASHADGCGLATWHVYTKGGKPDGDHLWSFLEKGKNWIPEAQGTRAKWIEVTIVKTTALSENHTSKNVVLLKGGFGAGKTRFINLMFGEHAAGAVAPDKAKQIDRRSNSDIPHSAAHFHGLQAAYEMGNEMIHKQDGTVIYDSSLSNPADISNYLRECKKAGKKMVVYDVARNDMARVLSVLNRSVGGEDPRIPPDLIISSAVKDKMNRVKCMEVVLNNATNDKNLNPEYHFIGGDKEGWNTAEVMVLSSNGKIELQPNAEERLGFEGIQIHVKENKLELMHDEALLQKYYNDQFEKPVRDIMKEISVSEQANLSVFKSRSFPMKPGVKVDSATDLYLALPKYIQAAISQKAFENSFASVQDDARHKFFSEIQSKSEFSYEDLPLRVALSIHQNLKSDPWK